MLQFLEVSRPYPGRLGNHLPIVLQPDKLPHPLEGKLELIGIEDMEHHDIVPTETQVVNALDKILRVVQQVREDHHHAAPGHARGEFV